MKIKPRNKKVRKHLNVNSMNNSKTWPFDDTVLRNSLEANHNIALYAVVIEGFLLEALWLCIKYLIVHLCTHTPSHVKSLLMSVKMCISYLLEYNWVSCKRVILVIIHQRKQLNEKLEYKLR